jgi:hypothetical protein
MNINRFAAWALGAGLTAVACMALGHFRQPPSTFTCANGTCASKDFGRAAFRDTRWYELGPKGWDACSWQIWSHGRSG